MLRRRSSSALVRARPGAVRTLEALAREAVELEVESVVLGDQLAQLEVKSRPLAGAFRYAAVVRHEADAELAP